MSCARLTFLLSLLSIIDAHAVEQGIPTIVVASLFQKDPLILMSHPGVGLDSFADLPKATAFIGKDNLVSVYQWLKNAHENPVSGAIGPHQKEVSGSNIVLQPITDHITKNFGDLSGNAGQRADGFHRADARMVISDLPGRIFLQQLIEFHDIGIVI